MKQDNMKFEILEDGTISLTTDEVSGANHFSADELLKELGSLVGGPVVVKNRERFHLHADLGGALRAHTHDGHTHQHG